MKFKYILILPILTSLILSNGMKLSIGVNLNTLLSPNVSTGSSTSNLPSSDVFMLEGSLPILKTFKVGGGLLFSRAAYNGGGESGGVKYDASETSLGLGAFTFLQIKSFKTGLLIANTSYKDKVDYADTSVDLSVETSILQLSPFIGANFEFANGKIALEAINYFNLYYVDDPDNDYDGSSTTQQLFLKLYIF